MLHNITTSLKRNTLIWLSLPLAQVGYDTGSNDLHPLRWEHDPQPNLQGLIFFFVVLEKQRLHISSYLGSRPSDILRSVYTGNTPVAIRNRNPKKNEDAVFDCFYWQVRIQPCVQHSVYAYVQKLPGKLGIAIGPNRRCH